MWAIRFYVRHPILMAWHHWRNRGKGYPKSTVSEMLSRVEELKASLDEQNHIPHFVHPHPPTTAEMDAAYEKALELQKRRSEG